MGKEVECMIFSMLHDFNSNIFSKAVNSYFFAFIVKNNQYDNVSAIKTET